MIIDTVIEARGYNQHGLPMHVELTGMHRIGRICDDAGSAARSGLGGAFVERGGLAVRASRAMDAAGRVGVAARCASEDIGRGRFADVRHGGVTHLILANLPVRDSSLSLISRLTLLIHARYLVIIFPMEIHYAKGTQRKLSEYYEPRERVDTFLDKVRDAKWRSPHDVKLAFGRVDVLGDGVLCFNILGNRFRLLARVDYEDQVFEVLFFGTHAEYDTYSRRRLRRR